MENYNMENEVWKPVKGYEGYYEVSSHGRVRTIDRVIDKSDGTTQRRRGKISALGTDKNGYHTLSLWKEGKAEFFRVARLVAIAFIENPENKPTVNHINGIKDDDKVSNLEWSTYSENMQHAYDTRLNINPKGEEHHLVKLTDLDVVEIRRLYESGELNQMKLAEKYNVRQPTISRIIHRKRWKHI